jgi:hypothetical protein
VISYSHTQRSPLLPFLATVVVALVAVVAVFSDEPVMAVGVVFIAGALLFLLTLVFGRLSVDVALDHLRVAFGAGWPAKTVPFADVVSATAVRNRWWYGWGIRWIPRGRLWNVWGLDAVELELGNGRRFRIGTDEPDELLAALSGKVILG